MYAAIRAYSLSIGMVMSGAAESSGRDGMDAMDRDAVRSAPRVTHVFVDGSVPEQAKGLEYDAVLVITPDDIVTESPGGVRALYVALTRPTQRLVTLDAAPDADWRKSLE